MRVSFYGVRGSIATAGESTRRYGGNTSCVAVEVAGEHLVFDAGTGIRALGSDLTRAVGIGRLHVNLFFSHLHWDHIQGFPFFVPAYIPGNTVRIHGCHEVLEAAFRRQQSAPSFPVSMEVMNADIEFVERKSEIRNPDGSVAFRNGQFPASAQTDSVLTVDPG